MSVRIYEAPLTEELLEKLIAFSVDWEEENSCTGYRANTKEDIEGRRIFLAEEDGEILGYLFGQSVKAEKMSSIMKEGTPYFGVDEIYVIPKRRSKGIGSALFRALEEAIDEEYIVLGTATKNYKAILHFYIEELGMSFWSASLYKKIPKKGRKKMKKQRERIIHYEELYDEIRAKTEALKKAAEDFEGLSGKIDELDAYYSGKLWKKDYADDEKGLLPKDLKRGVLSEDGVYDLLEEIAKWKELLGDAD
ncbi:MAG: GNAT family N-acetyltransferase [Erysipelotrichaceae bacterium]|nr:GNAT family N-acetyltransferase [Erysipelotrichaceae bacterium]